MVNTNLHTWIYAEFIFSSYLYVVYYSGFPIIRTPIIRILDYPYAWTSPCFRQQREKDVPVTGVLLQEKANLLYERLFPDATTPFSASTGFRSRFTTSELAERSRERCSTLYYSVAN